jgi:hypothetical protein
VFTLEDLIAVPMPLGSPLGRRPHKLLTNILTRKSHRFLPPNVPELRIPADVEASALIKEMLTDVDAVSGEWGLRALRATIERPQVRAAGRPLGSGARDYSIGAVVAGCGTTPSRFVVLSVRVRTENGSSILEGIRCRLLDLNDDAFRHELAAIYQEAESREKLIHPNRRHAVWLRGNRAAGVPPDWAGEAEAMAATYGFRLRIFREPDVKPTQTRTEIEAFEPALILLWDHDGRATGFCARASLDSLGVAIERLDGAWDSAMYQASCILAQSRNLAPPTTYRPPNVTAAVGQADTHPDVVILPAALRSASESAFRRPLDVVIALNELVEAVAGGALTAPGGLAEALKSASFRYAKGVSQTARQSGEYDRDYEGQKIVLGPHLKLGAGGEEHCLRVYWYVDQHEKKVIVGHIGKHLYDAGS